MLSSVLATLLWKQRFRVQARLRTANSADRVRSLLPASLLRPQRQAEHIVIPISLFLDAGPSPKPGPGQLAFNRLRRAISSNPNHPTARRINRSAQPSVGLPAVMQRVMNIALTYRITRPAILHGYPRAPILVLHSRGS